MPLAIPQKKANAGRTFPKAQHGSMNNPQTKTPPRIGTRGKEITNQASPIWRTRKTPWKGIIPQPPICTRQRQYSVST